MLEKENEKNGPYKAPGYLDIAGYDMGLKARPRTDSSETRLRQTMFWPGPYEARLRPRPTRLLPTSTLNSHKSISLTPCPTYAFTYTYPYPL